jgi:hypothetical protein
MRLHSDDRPDITVVERDRVIARMNALRDKSTDVNDRFYRVARRLQYWLAGVDNGAQWLALFDCIKHDYIRWRIDDSETIHHLRWLGIDVRNGDREFFGKEAEMARRANAAKLKAQLKARFDAVTWELDFNRRKAAAE